ncbi:aminodeoxychorismate synthase component I [Parahaliea mediterranea]|uniref:aminodeoxychorismate synthase n=1 Tax=Parahaliea mediterranea TaxID=651086 RepID=A0A939DIC9_9GAMM|nr:aminodeoxychorismate synthase component I [Parahaliea mediterranea]
MHIDDIPYRGDSCALFESLRDLPGAAFLDSCHGAPRGGRFDILVADPLDDGPPRLAGKPSARQCEDYFSDLAQFHRERYAGIHSPDADLPFCGGLLGYLDYEAGAGLQRVAMTGKADTAAPLARVDAYDWCVIQDHLLSRAALVSLPSLPAHRRRDYLARLRQAGGSAPVGGGAHGAPFRLDGVFTANMSRPEYARAFDRIADYIRAGDCYQVNLAQRFAASYSGDPWQAYTWLRREAGAPYSAYLALGDGDALLSLSPERFITLRGNRVETRPIKGTRPRDLTDPSRDGALAQALLASPKDRAENLMIVDLLRNDLGRSCVPGSIRVDKLFEVESYPTVHHLVSTISGELRAGRGAVELLRDSFPGGSITGAPKRRAMEIIAELEPHPRQAYCGSVLYISADGRMDSNIAIRSLLCQRGEILCWGGGGIVADSECEREYQETFDKVGRFLRCLEQRSGLA